LDHLRRQLLLAPGLLHLLLAFDPPRHPPTPGPLRELFHGLRQGEAWQNGPKGMVFWGPWRESSGS
jgi:hypothetical protein